MIWPGTHRLISAALLGAAVVLLLSMPLAAQAAEGLLNAPSEPGFRIVLFWGDGCPHCEEEWKFLKALKARHPEVEVKDFEVWKNKENAAGFKEFMEKLGQKQAVVPTTIIGNLVMVGFGTGEAEVIERKLKEFREHRRSVEEAEGTAVTLPLVGRVEPSDFSLPVFTLIIAGLDSFNPCAMYVLLFLLSLLIHAKSRARMLLIGGTFVFFSGAIYFLFMAAWLNLFVLAGRVAYLTMAAGGLALVVAVINIKDFFAFKEGVSLTMSEEAQHKLIVRMRGLLSASSLPMMMAGTVALAVLANGYELLCTAGFPMVYTRVLTLNKLGQTGYYTYLALYNLVYVLPLAAIVVAFTVTLGSRKLTEWQGRVLKLVSGMMMLSLGAVLLARPELLNNPVAAALMLALSLLLSWALVALYRWGQARKGAKP